MANFIGGTAQMSRYAAQSENREFIVGTEANFVYRLRKDNPRKRFYSVHSLCDGMNIITLEKIKLALEQMEYIVEVPESIRKKAKIALDKMLMVQ
jgi:quinolinate synthase